MLKATFVPTFIPTPAFVLIVIATIGTTIAPWMQFFVQSNIVDKGATVKDLLYQRVDVIGGAVAANIIAWFIIVTTATVLYPRGIAADSAEKAALALAPVAGQYASVLFAIGLFGASLLAAFVLPLTAAYAVTEAFGFERGIDRTWAEAPVFNGIYTFVIFFGAAFVLIPSAPLIVIMVLSQAVNGVLLPFLLIFMMKIVNDRRIMGRYVNGRVYNVIGWTTVVVVIGLTVTLLVMPALGVEMTMHRPRSPHADAIAAAKHAARQRAHASRANASTSPCAAVTRSSIAVAPARAPRTRRCPTTVLAYAAMPAELDPSFAINALRAARRAHRLPAHRSPRGARRARGRQRDAS